jgi:hypothetical protein
MAPTPAEKLFGGGAMDQKIVDANSIFKNETEESSQVVISPKAYLPDHL